MTAKLTIADHLNNATEADLAALDKEIEVKVAELEKLESQIVALRTARRIVDELLHGKKPRKKPERKAKSMAKATHADAAADGEDPLRQKIFDLLHREGSLPVPAIAGRLGRPPAVVGMCVATCKWFDKDSRGEVSIRKDAR